MNYTGEERRDTYKLQVDFCKSQFKDIKESLASHGKEIKEHGEIIKNGLSHRTQRIEALLWVFVEGLGVFWLKEVITHLFKT